MRSDAGQNMIEYTLLAAFLAIFIVVVFESVAQEISFIPRVITGLLESASDPATPKSPSVLAVQSATPPGSQIPPVPPEQPESPGAPAGPDLSPPNP